MSDSIQRVNGRPSDAVIEIQMNIMKGLVTGRPVGEILTLILTAIEQRVSGCVGLIWVIEQHLGQLALSLVASVNGPDAQSVDLNGFTGEVVKEGLNGSLADDFLQYVRNRLRALGLEQVALHAIANTKGRIVGLAAIAAAEPGRLTQADEHVLRFYAVAGGLAIEKDQLDRENHFLTYYDFLTRIPNRRWFHDCMQAAIQHAEGTAEPFSLVIIDLDDFKRINDCFGHAVGDEVLTATATRMAACIRKADILARIGGDEFAIILPTTGADQALALVDAILQSMQQTRAPVDRELTVAMSAGISCYPVHGTDQDTLLKCADLALYEAKKVSGVHVCMYATVPSAQTQP